MMERDAVQLDQILDGCPERRWVEAVVMKLLNVTEDRLKYVTVCDETPWEPDDDYR